MTREHLETVEDIEKVRRLAREATSSLERLPMPFAKAGQRAIAELAFSVAVFERLVASWEAHRSSEVGR